MIANVLQSMPIYLLSAMNPLKKIVEQLHQVFAKFLSSKLGGDKGNHWVAWKELCYPKVEGEIGFKSLSDVSKELFGKHGGSLKLLPLCGVSSCELSTAKKFIS